MLMLDNCFVNFFSLFCWGQYYLKMWLLEKCFVLVFVENCVIKMMCYVICFMLLIVVFIFCWQIVLGGQFGLVVVIVLFVLSLFMQGLWWLGKCFVTLLFFVIFNWFYEVCGKLQEFGQVLVFVEGKFDYQVLVDMFKCVFK